MIFPTFLTFLITLNLVTSVIIHCDYKDGSTYGYKCDISYLQIISKDDRNITGITGSHKIGKSNADVKFLHSNAKIINFFPKNIENFFKNLETIWINNAKMQEISGEDLKVFTKLKRFSLGYNEIEVLSSDVFKFNGNLEWIDVESNRIKHVETGALSSLKSLKEMYFHGNACHFGGAGNRNSTILLVNEIERKCKDAFYVVKKLQEETEIKMRKFEAELNEIKINCKCSKI